MADAQVDSVPGWLLTYEQDSQTRTEFYDGTSDTSLAYALERAENLERGLCRVVRLDQKTFVRTYHEETDDTGHIVAGISEEYKDYKGGATMDRDQILARWVKP